ncbi:hypothetical protein GcM3_089017, partial [Golovinomyces cichoracearum]
NNAKYSSNTRDLKTEPSSPNPTNYNPNRTHPDSYQSYIPPGQIQSSSTQNQHGRDISNLAKCYTEDLKYTGDSDDNFDEKFDIFMEMSTRFSLANEALVYAFPTMLKNIALSFYFNCCRGKSLAKLCQAMKDNF